MKKHWVHFQVNSYYCTEFLETQAKGTLFGVAQDPPELLTYQNSNAKVKGEQVGLHLWEWVARMAPSFQNNNLQTLTQVHHKIQINFQLHNKVSKTWHFPHPIKQFTPKIKARNSRVLVVHQKKWGSFVPEHTELGVTKHKRKAKQNQNQATSFDSEHSRIGLAQRFLQWTAVQLMSF